MPIYSGFSHEKWWFSIAMLVHQRVIIAGFWMFLVMFGAAPYLFVWKKTQIRLKNTLNLNECFDC